jgi:hypothetical protein
MLNLRQIGTSGVQIKGAGISDFCSALAAIVGPAQNMFFLTVHSFNSFAFIAQQAGWQPCWVARHLVCVSVTEYRES